VPDFSQLVVVVMELISALAVIIVVIWMRSIQSTQQRLGETLQRMNESQSDITHTQRSIVQVQRDQTSILQHLVTQISVMDARQDAREGGYHPNE
jgi:hypothetical protein